MSTEIPKVISENEFFPFHICQYLAKRFAESVLPEVCISLSGSLADVQVSQVIIEFMKSFSVDLWGSFVMDHFHFLKNLL